MCTQSRILLIIFLFSNAILVLNFIIAIMNTIYEEYEKKQKGLYYEVLVKKFPSMKFDERYGAICCAAPIFNLIILPFWPIS